MNPSAEAVNECTDRWRTHMRGCPACSTAHRPAEYCTYGKSLVATLREAERMERLHREAERRF